MAENSVVGSFEIDPSPCILGLRITAMIRKRRAWQAVIPWVARGRGLAGSPRPPLFANGRKPEQSPGPSLLTSPHRARRGCAVDHSTYQCRRPPAVLLAKLVAPRAGAALGFFLIKRLPPGPSNCPEGLGGKRCPQAPRIVASRTVAAAIRIARPLALRDAGQDSLPGPVAHERPKPPLLTFITVANPSPFRRGEPERRINRRWRSPSPLAKGRGGPGVRSIVNRPLPKIPLSKICVNRRNLRLSLSFHLCTAFSYSARHRTLSLLSRIRRRLSASAAGASKHSV